MKLRKLLPVWKSERRRTVEELAEAGEPGNKFHLLLLLSSIVVSAGILANNAAITVGGILIAPLLTPVLLIGFGLSVGDVGFAKRMGKVAGKAFLVVLAGAAAMGLCFDTESGMTMFPAAAGFRGALLYFAVALASGFAATYAWVCGKSGETVPGVAVTVSLVPPLALLGLQLASFQLSAARLSLLMTSLNLVGVLCGGLLVFSFFKIPKRGRGIEEKTERTV